MIDAVVNNQDVELLVHIYVDIFETVRCELSDFVEGLLGQRQQLAISTGRSLLFDVNLQSKL